MNGWLIYVLGMGVTVLLSWSFFRAQIREEATKGELPIGGVWLGLALFWPIFLVFIVYDTFAGEHDYAKKKGDGKP